MNSLRLEKLALSLQTIQENHLWRTRRTLQTAQGDQVILDDKPLISFGSNDYLGLANHPDLKIAAHMAIDQYGIGAGASCLLSGHHTLHHQVEIALAKMVGFEKCVYFCSGFSANLAVLSTLFDANDHIISDQLNHASLIDGMRLSKAHCTITPHVDLIAVEMALKLPCKGVRCVVTDSVFSMDGTIAPIEALAGLCQKYDAWLMIDDAHGFGVLGKRGEGVLGQFNWQPYQQQIIYMGTLGKAAGVNGAFVASQNQVIELLIQKSRSYVFSTAPSPLLAASLLASLNIIQTGQRQNKLIENIKFFKNNLKLLQWHLLDSETCIQPIVIGDSAKAMQAMQLIEKKGIWTPAIRFPTVPEGTARLRISLSASHNLEQIKQLCLALQWAEKQ